MADPAMHSFYLSYYNAQKSTIETNLFSGATWAGISVTSASRTTTSINSDEITIYDYVESYLQNINVSPYQYYDKVSGSDRDEKNLFFIPNGNE